MQLKKIKITELKSLLKSEIYLYSKNIPITKQRVLSQILNPRAKKEDIALVIALDKTNKVIGFIGALPEKIPNKNIKVAWNSCWWIDSKKGKQIAIPLFLTFLKVYDNNVMFRDLTPKTEQILERLNLFKKVKNLTGYRYFLRINSFDFIRNKNKLFKYCIPILRVGDFMFNAIVSLKNKSFLKLKNKNFTAIKVNKIDDEIEKFVFKNNKNELFKRSKKELNWILDKPWIVSKSHKKTNQFYYFSDTSKLFKNYLYKIYDLQKNLVAVLFLSNNNGLVKLPYVYFSKDKESIVVSFLYQFLLQEKASSFFIINPILNNQIQKKTNPFWYIKKIEKDFVVSKKIADTLPEQFDFQDGEGDFVFT